MNTFLLEYSNNNWVLQSPDLSAFDEKKIQLALCFANKSYLENESIYANTKAQFPNAEIVLCSTAGEILNNKVLDNGCILAAFEFKKTPIKTVSISIADTKNSFDAAEQLVSKLPKDDLKYIMVFSDGSLVNGSELVKGLNVAAGNKILITGGLAGDGANFESTLIGLNCQPKQGELVAIGFYGDSIQANYGSQGGWTPFGLEKRITKSSNNVLYELENENALDIYKKYLGNDADGLPGSALLFPLSIILPNTTQPVVRTILSINEDEKTMTFAGDLPEGSKVRFMRSNLENLTQAAGQAAHNSKASNNFGTTFSLLVSCVGRKLIMGNNTVDEVTSVINTLGKDTVVAGFYSYGEIAPFNEGGNCQLHNQTMTITSLYENV